MCCLKFDGWWPIFHGSVRSASIEAPLCTQPGTSSWLFRPHICCSETWDASWSSFKATQWILTEKDALASWNGNIYNHPLSTMISHIPMIWLYWNHPLIKNLTMPRVAQQRPMPDLHDAAMHTTRQFSTVHHPFLRIAWAWIRSLWDEPYKACILSYLAISRPFMSFQPTRHLALQQAQQLSPAVGASLRPWALRWAPACCQWLPAPAPQGVTKTGAELL